jgi:hypothetical protein
MNIKYMALGFKSGKTLPCNLISAQNEAIMTNAYKKTVDSGLNSSMAKPKKTKNSQ